MLLPNRLYAGIVDVPEYGVRAKRGDFEPLISEDLFHGVQAVLAGRVPSITPSSVRIRISHSAPSSGASLADARPHRPLVDKSAISQPKWRFAKARPEPDFR